LSAFGLSPRIKRAAIILLGGWLVLEFALLQLVATRIGWGATMAFLSVKGGIGLLIIGFMIARGMRHLRQAGTLRMAITGQKGIFAVISGILITLPGLLPPLAGIALFSPSAQKAVLSWFLRDKANPKAPRDFDLDDSEWREVKRRKLVQRKPSRKASLETKPPSV